jgi:hypothetical protein
MLIHFIILYCKGKDAMKVYVHIKGIIMVGKAWEIKQKLLEYQRQFETVKEWIAYVNQK